MSRVAFIGLGIMGAPMARSLLAALRAQGHGRLDHGALLLLVDQLSGRTDLQDGDQA